MPRDIARDHIYFSVTVLCLIAEHVIENDATTRAARDNLRYCMQIDAMTSRVASRDIDLRDQAPTRVHSPALGFDVHATPRPSAGVPTHFPDQFRVGVFLAGSSGTGDQRSLTRSNPL
jgi:hypothetical protein